MLTFPSDPDLTHNKQDHAAALEALKSKGAAAHQDTLKELESQNVTHQEALDALKTTHAKELAEAHDRVNTGNAEHATELEQLQASHAEAIAALKKEHEAAQENLSSVAEKHRVSGLYLLFDYLSG